jgi:hypothetical protein
MPSSGPEASCAVALAIVHPVSRHVCFDLADQPGLGPFAVEQGEPVTYREDKASVRTKRDGADWLAYVDRLVVTAPCVEAMDALGGNIDPDELAALGVPEGPSPTAAWASRATSTSSCRRSASSPEVLDRLPDAVGERRRRRGSKRARDRIGLEVFGKGAAGCPRT